jgi:hypothetical protein
LRECNSSLRKECAESREDDKEEEGGLEREGGRIEKIKKRSTKECVEKEDGGV